MSVRQQPTRRSQARADDRGISRETSARYHPSSGRGSTKGKVMRGMLFVISLLACLTANASAQDANAISTAQGDLMLCVRHAAVRLEPSGEPAADVATGAVWSCQPQEAKLFNLLLHSQDPGTTPTNMRASAEFVAKAQVEWTRLCRKTKDCAFSP